MDMMMNRDTSVVLSSIYISGTVLNLGCALLFQVILRDPKVKSVVLLENTLKHVDRNIL